MLRSAVLETQDNSWIRSWLMVIGGSFLIALFGRIAIPLPFSPVPIALQPHICLLLGALLGSRKGSLAVLLFLAQGIIGLPVFALGKAGITILLGPTGGYLMGYVIGAWLTGYIIERSNRRSLWMGALLFGNLAIYLCGMAQLAHFVGAQRVFFVGMLPFLLGDLIKSVVSYKILSSHKHRRKMGETFPS